MGLITGYFNLLSLDDGKPGATGAKCRMRLWTEGDYYLSGAPGEEWFDIVWMRDNPKQPYRCTKTITSSGKLGVNDPVTSIQKHLGIWQAAQNWAFIATDLVLSRLIKASEIDADGIRAKNVDISGKITATEGFIGAFKIDGNGLSNVSDNPLAFITIEKNGGKYFNVNVGESYMCDIRADFKTALRAQCFGNGSIAISALSNGKKDSFAIQSYGNVELNARVGETIRVGGLCIQSRSFADFDAESEKVIKSNDDFLLIQATQNDIIINLPDIHPGKILFIKKIGSKKVTLKGDIRWCANNNIVDNLILDGVSYMFIQEDSPSSAFTKPTWCYYHCG